MEKIIYPYKYLLPKYVNSFWPVVACDQFTSEKKYWEDLSSFVGSNPSTLNLILPETYLEKDNSKKIDQINKNMKSYLDNNIFTETDNGYILIERTYKSGLKHIGLVCTVDLEHYDYSTGSDSKIRATEKTVEERIPPRLEIRKNAPIELSHTMILLNDKKEKVIESLYENKDKYKLIYDIELSMNGGHIKGWFIKDDENISNKLDKLCDKGMPLAVGDGNHSMATAKKHWESIKNKTNANSPARFFLCEISNIYDEGIYFEPIYRLLKTSDDKILEELQSLKGSFTLLKGNKEIKHISNENLPTTLINIDNFSKEHNIEEDYIHGLDNIKALIKDGYIGIIFDSLKKEDLFEYVENNGTLPKKTFSMGEGIEKKYYIESKFI